MSNRQWNGSIRSINRLKDGAHGGEGQPGNRGGEKDPMGKRAQPCGTRTQRSHIRTGTGTWGETKKLERRKNGTQGITVTAGGGLLCGSEGRELGQKKERGLGGAGAEEGQNALGGENKYGGGNITPSHNGKRKENW